MSIRSLGEERLQHPKTLAAFRTVKGLVGGYLVISLLALMVIIVLHNNTTIAPVPAPVWVRGIIVVVHAGITMSFAARMARGSRVGYILLLISSVGMTIAIAVILAIPGDFPLWFKIEQGICGLPLLGVIIMLLGKRARSVFAKN